MTHLDSTTVRSLKPNPFFVFLEIFGNLVWIVILLILVLRIFVYQQVQVDGLSMFPNYDDKEYLLMNQLDKNFKRGQVVAVFAHRNFADEVAHKMNPIQGYLARFDCQKPQSRQESDCHAKFYLKRIIGLPGEEIEVIGGTVIIYNQDNPQGVALTESYIPQSTFKQEEARSYYFPRTKIAEKEYFLMGDNRSNSMDSRAVGTFADYSIFGQENFRITPSIQNFSLPQYTYSPLSESIKERLNLQKSTNLVVNPQ
jgi:signal peptidase I